MSDRQFRETENERADRWRATKAKRKAEGKCWQCAKPVADCQCHENDENYCGRYCALERRAGEDCALNGGCPLRRETNEEATAASVAGGQKEGGR